MNLNKNQTKKGKSLLKTPPYNVTLNTDTSTEELEQNRSWKYCDKRDNVKCRSEIKELSVKNITRGLN